jgi:hypothetical protein
MTSSRNSVKFVLFFIGRTGSTYLTQALSSHPEIAPGAEWEPLVGKDGNQQLQAVRKLLTQPPYGYHPSVGFKTKLEVVENPEVLARLLRELGARIIVLQRRNSIKHVVSQLNSHRIHDVTGYWNLYKTEDRLPPATIDVAEFDRRLGQIEKEKHALETYASNLELPTLFLHYEDLLVDLRATLAEVFSFLRVRFEPTQSKCYKNTSDDLREALSNFDELRSHYIGTPYEQMFDEVLVSAQ